MANFLRDISIRNDIGGLGPGPPTYIASFSGGGIRSTNTNWILQNVPPNEVYQLTTTPQPAVLVTEISPLLPNHQTNNVIRWQATTAGPSVIPLSKMFQCLGFVRGYDNQDYELWLYANGWQCQYQILDGQGQPTGQWSDWIPKVAPS